MRAVAHGVVFGFALVVHLMRQVRDQDHIPGLDRFQQHCGKVGREGVQNAEFMILKSQSFLSLLAPIYCPQPTLQHLHHLVEGLASLHQDLS
jgi:hypothetical protein